MDVVGRYRRRSAELDEAIVEAYISGSSMRDVGGITEALVGERASRSTVSRVTASLAREHWHRIRSTNGLEWTHGEIKRRTRAIGAFPDRASALRLVTAVARSPPFGPTAVTWTWTCFLSRCSLRRDEVTRGAP